MSQTTEEDVLTGTAPTTEESFYFNLGEEIARSSIKTANDALQRLVTLSGAMLGGSAVVLRPELVDLAPRVIAAVCLALSLAVSLIGSFPFETNICINNP